MQVVQRSAKEELILAAERLIAVHGLAGVQSIQSYKALQAVTEDRSQPSEVLVAARRALGETKRKLFGDAAPPETT